MGECQSQPMVACTYQAEGCKWEGEQRYLNNHLNRNPLEKDQLEGCQFVKIKCRYCSKLRERQKMLTHLDKWCLKRPTECPYCKNYTESYDYVTTKHRDQCLDYPMQCSNGCNSILKRKDMQKHITHDCPQTEVQCKFHSKGCDMKLLRKDLMRHITFECQEADFDCEFKHVGCNVRLTRKDIPSHQHNHLIPHLLQLQTYEKKQAAILSDIEKFITSEEIIRSIHTTKKSSESYVSLALLHHKQVESKIKYLTEKCSELEKHIINQERQISELKTDLSRYECKLSHMIKITKMTRYCKALQISLIRSTSEMRFIINNYERLKNEDKIWYSRPFYTHPLGYKLHLLVYLNGFGDRRGTHISIFVQIRRGEFDDMLEWPFRGKVVILLLNQEEDKGHISATFKFIDCFFGCASLTPEGEVRTSKGIIDFIPHRNLKPKYLKGDCLKLCPRITTYMKHCSSFY